MKNFIAVQFYRPIRVQNYRTRQYQTVFLVFRENIEYQISHGITEQHPPTPDESSNIDVKYAANDIDQSGGFCHFD